MTDLNNLDYWFHDPTKFSSVSDISRLGKSTESNLIYTPLMKLLAWQARLGKTYDGSGTKAETYSSISATNQHQSRQKIYQ